MTYTPIDDADFKPAIPGTSALWPSLIANDRACFEEYSPGAETNPYPEATTAAREFRLMWLGNYDNQQLRVGVRAVSSSGSKTVTVATTAVDSDTVSVSTLGWYDVSVDASGPEQEVIISCAAPSPQTLAFSGIRAHLDVAAPAAGVLYPSGWRQVGTVWGTSGYPVPSEVQSRHRTNPARLARERPVCVYLHCADTLKTVSAKSLDLWGVENLTTWVQVGRGRVPRCDFGERWYRCYAYANETTADTAEYSVRIGPTEELWTGVGWHSWRVQLGSGPHEVWANVLPGGSNKAAIRTLEVWRSELVP